MRPPRLRLTAVAAGVGLGLLVAGPAWAHEERKATPPDGSGSVPQFRAQGPTLLVCKDDPADFALRIAGFDQDLLAANQALWTQCQTEGFRHLQAAVDHVTAPGTTIKILPGEYREEPSLAEPTGECATLSAPTAAAGYQVLSYEQQVACPHNQNLVAILGKTDLQIEGTGAKPEDVVLDAQFKRLNAIRSDRSNGIYLRNFTAQRTTFNAVYIMESDGFVIDTMVGRWNDEYGFLTFADDHGLYTGCEAYGNGDSGIYPGAPANLNADRGHDADRYAIEIHDCYSHDNLLGYSGTAGDSVWAHDNRFIHNSVGVATDSAFPGHPGLPQNHALFENNVIGNNNVNYYEYVRDGTCAKPSAQRGYEDAQVVCPAVGVPVGTGVLNPGGNYNIWRNNWVYGNDYAGFVTSWVPGFIRGDNSLGAQFDTSHHNRYYGNHLGVTPEGARAANGMDFWWDGQGVGSCWQEPSAGSEPLALPACGEDNMPAGLGSARLVAEPLKVAKLYVCADYDLDSARLPSRCEWYGARGLDRIEVRLAAAEAALLGVVLLFTWWRLVRWSGLAILGVLLAVAGLVIGVYGTLDEASVLTPIGLNLLGAGWVVFGIMLHRKGRPGLGFLTASLGVLSLVGAIDRGIWIIPYVPVPPSLWRFTLEAFWVPAALLVAFRGRRRGTRVWRRPPRPPKRTGDDLEAFTATLRL